MGVVKVYSSGVNVSIEHESGAITTIAERHARYQIHDKTFQGASVTYVVIGDSLGYHPPIEIKLSDLRNGSDAPYANAAAVRSDFNTYFGG